MKRLTRLSNKDPSATLSSAASVVKSFKPPKIPFSKEWFLRAVITFVGVSVVVLLISYFFVFRPLLAIASEARELKAATAGIKNGLHNLNFSEIKDGLNASKEGLDSFKKVYEENMSLVRKIPGVELYYRDGQHLLSVAEQGLELGYLVVDILEPYATDLGFSTNGGIVTAVPAQERVVMLLSLMPQFSSEVSEISERVKKIDSELAQIDASRYPRKLPGFVNVLRVNSEVDIRGQILSLQSISHELSEKSPQFETLFNAVPEFMGLNEPKKYLVIMANNYELRMSGGFNTYIVVTEFMDGIPQINYSIDTFFIDEGDRTGSSFLVNRNVPYHLRNYLYIQERGGRLYARDATSTSPDFPTAADKLLEGFWRRDRSLPQDIDGVIQINNDVVVNLLKIVGPVNTEKYSIRTDQGGYITVPVTEFNADNVIVELENIAGGKLAETLGRKEIIKFLAQSIFEKIFTSEATNLVSIVKVGLDALGKKDIILYSFDVDVQKAFEGLGYAGRIASVPDGWDYLYVNRSNYGSGKADWTKEGFVTQKVEKNMVVKGGRKVSVVKVIIDNPKRPSWFNIDPCCFYNAYLRVYVPKGSKLISVTASDGQDPNGAEFVDEVFGKTYFESFTRQLKETTLTVTFEYELPDSVNLDDYNILVQRQPGTSVDTYAIGVEGVSQEILLNSDKVLSF